MKATINNIIVAIEENQNLAIKKVLPIFTNFSYDDLAVNNGMEAMLTYSNEDNLKAKQKELKEYCKQDTWAMVEILKGLRKLINILTPRLWQPLLDKRGL